MNKALPMTIAAKASALVAAPIYLDEEVFFHQFRPRENLRGNLGLVVVDEDVLFDSADPEVTSAADEYIWSLMENDCGEGLLRSGRHSHAIGHLISSRPVETGRAYAVTLEGL